MRRPDFQEVDNIRRILQRHNDELPPRDRIGDWRGQWQIDMVHAMLDSQWVNIQGIPQNSGKTTCACLVSAPRILDGQAGVWGYPTIRQGSRVGLRRFDAWMKILEDEFGIKRDRPDAAFEKTWDNGAQFMVLSMDVSAKSGVQGYTLDFGFLDEGHEILQVDEVIGAVFSRFDIAMQEGHGTCCVMGVGGPKESLIERVKEIEDFRSFKFDATRIYSEYPSARASIDRAKRMLPRVAYEQFYELKPVAIGTRNIFHSLLTEVPSTGVARYAIGIDVGKTTDYTIGVRLMLRRSTTPEVMSTVQIHDVCCIPHNLRFSEQADMLNVWMRETEKANLPDGLTVETNGQGIGLLEALQELYPAVGGLHIEDNPRNTGLKSLLIQELQILSQQGRLACAQDLYVSQELPDVHKHLSRLTYTVDENARVIWEHSDVLSALIMAISNCDID